MGRLVRLEPKAELNPAISFKPLGLAVQWETAYVSYMQGAVAMNDSALVDRYFRAEGPEGNINEGYQGLRGWFLNQKRAMGRQYHDGPGEVPLLRFIQ